VVLPSMDRAKHTRDNVEPHDATAVAHLPHFGVTSRAFSAAIKCSRVRSQHTLCLPPLAVLPKSALSPKNFQKSINQRVDPFLLGVIVG